MDKKVSSQCHCINIRRAANAVTKYYDRVLKKSGLTVNQYSILCSIQKIEPCSVTALSKRTRLDRTTLVRNLKPIFSAGWIKDEAAEGNRKNQIHLTKAGHEKIAAAKADWEQAQAYLESNLGKGNLQILKDCLLKLEEICG